LKTSFTTLVKDHHCSSKGLNDYKRKRGGFKSAYFKCNRFYIRNIYMVDELSLVTVDYQQSLL